MNNELYKQVKDLYDKGLNSLAISYKLGIARRTAQRYIRYVKKNTQPINNQIQPLNNAPQYLWQLPENQKPEKRVIGVIPDLHLDASKIEYLNFLIETFVKWGVTDIVCLGDIYDQHSIELHAKEPDAKGVLDELNDSKLILKEYIKVFPTVKYCLGNHCIFYLKKAAGAGIPASFMKTFKELLDLPDTWDVAEQHIINNCLFIHGTQFVGRTAITNICNITGMSTIVGHEHTVGGVYYTNTGFKNLYAMVCGCLIDCERYNFAYSRNNKYKPVLGCGIVIDDQEAYFIKLKNGGIK